ncbi:hypothetical protein B0T24DRAFT_659000 [Lasiosphaeria ovina]|uniref:F-box domain-containing protein n=1 Tax=Lasiosphaeria ovina TaxID=92902 RepID=A0AAE0JZ24_9PEZI|nr:hypothetical protein B0T24DRAFT_659000 [Lasiosphaeria ovina]
MGTRGLKMVRFRGRYYIRYQQYDSYYECLGAEIVASVPSDPEEYQKWLKSMRAEYAAKERVLNQHVYEIRDGSKPDYSLFNEFEELPSELPRLEDCGAEYFYIINLDREILTMNFGIHWQLGNIPRQDDLWIRAIADSIYLDKPTISLDVCPGEHMASPALKLPKRNEKIGYGFNIVTPKTDITDKRTVFLTYVLAETLIVYMDTIIRFGREWSPDSFPFRELTFALVSIASGQAKFHSFPAYYQSCQSSGWLDEKWAGDWAPLLEFGSMSHRPGDPPGASPIETMYWLEDVLVSLTLVVDGEAITNAVTWGIKQGRTSFQIVVLSLFNVAFAEVLVVDDEPFIQASRQVNLSPLLAQHCLSTHPRKRPEKKPGMQIQRPCGERIMQSNCTGSVKMLRDHFPGLVSLVNFFEVAASRRAASKSPVILPPVNSFEVAASRGAAPKSPVILPTEMHDRILDFIDYDTWRACLVVSPKFRSYCLHKFRVNDRMSIVAGPFVKYDKKPRVSHHKQPRLSFDFEDTQTGEVFRMTQHFGVGSLIEGNWMPVIGSDRKALMLEVTVQFGPASAASHV